jgi:energy-coupling factor transporter transmembrane protein EcfT
MEQGRFAGMALSGLVSNPFVRIAAVLLFAAFLTMLVVQGNWVGLGVIGAIAIGVLFLAAIARQDLREVRRRRRR